jgi:hypothetical protein
VWRISIEIALAACGGLAMTGLKRACPETDAPLTLSVVSASGVWYDYNTKEVGMFYEGVFKALNAARVKYLVAGGVAVNLHGFVRATADLDILISLDDENVKRFIGVAKKRAFKPRVPVKIEDFADPEKRKSWIQEKRMKVFSVYNPADEFEHIDVMIDVCIDFDHAFLRKKIINIGPMKVPVVGLKDLIKLKEAANRGRDLMDIAALKRLGELKNGKEK